MSEDAIWKRLRKVVVEVFDDDEVLLEPSTTAADVDGWDSISNIELMIALEQEFRIRFNTGEMAALANVGQLVERISTRLGELPEGGQD